MANALSPYQIFKQKGHAGLTRDTHISSYFGKQPQMASKNMVKLLQINYGRSLESELAKFGEKYLETTEDFYWDIIGSERRNIPLKEARYQGSTVTGSTNNVGIGGSIFELVFGEHYFFPSEVIVGEQNERYRIRVISFSEEGTDTVYTVRLSSEAWGSGMPGSELISNKRFSYEYTSVSYELSRGAGGVRFSSHSRVTERFSNVRLDHKVSGNRHNETLVIPMPFMNNSGKVILAKTWMQVEEYQLERTWQEYKYQKLKYGRSNKSADGEFRDLDPKTNIPIKEGDGLRAQMQRSHTYYYHDDDNVIKILTDILYQLSFNKVPISDRRFLVSTGQQGAIRFHEDILRSGSGWIPIVNGTAVTDPTANIITATKVSSPLHKNAYSAGFQFVEYQAPNGMIISLDVQDGYDDSVRFKKLHSKTNFPLESYRYDIWYIGKMDDGESNIYKVYGGGTTEYRGYSWGPFRNPFDGRIGNTNSSYDEDSAVVHKYCPALGIMMRDPSRSLSLIHAQEIFN